MNITRLAYTLICLHRKQYHNLPLVSLLLGDIKDEFKAYDNRNLFRTDLKVNNTYNVKQTQTDLLKIKPFVVSDLGKISLTARQISYDDFIHSLEC